MTRKAKTPRAPAPSQTPHRPVTPPSGQPKQQRAQRPMPPKRVPQRHQGR